MTDGNQQRTGYKDIARDLRQQIRDGSLLPGELLPSEPALSRQHGVNITTVRQAIAQLRIEGLVVTATGRGTSVRPQIPVATLKPERLRRAAEIAVGVRPPDLTQPGSDPGSERTQEWGHADEVEAALLERPLGDRVLRRWSLVRSHGRPRMETISCIPADVLGDTVPDPADDVFVALHRAGVDVLRLRDRERVSARMPDAEEAEKLAIVGVYPLLVVRRTMRAEDRVVECATEIRYPADRMELEYEIDLSRP